MTNNKFFLFIFNFMLKSIFSQINWSNTYTVAVGNPLYQDSCASGFIQSPINLNLTSSYYTNVMSIVYENYTTNTSAVPTMSNKYINFTDSAMNYGSILFERAGYISLYNLTDIRIKIPSEHSIAGVKGVMEIQLIHKKVIGQFYQPNQNVMLPDANTVLGISIIYTDQPANFSDNGFAKDLIASYQSGNVTLGLNLNKYQITLGKKFYLYEGAETSYPCDENLNWIVMSDFYSVDSSYTAIKSKYANAFTGNSNTKTIAPLMNRPIFRNFKVNNTDTAVYIYPINSSDGLKFSLISLIISFLIILKILKFTLKKILDFIKFF